ncbi:MAG: hypothetical protein ACT4OS_09930 [Acidimicrobiales bacterium]
MRRAQLSTIISALEDVANRVSALADEISARPGNTNRTVGAQGESSGDIATLFEVERALRGALRRLNRLRPSE